RLDQDGLATPLHRCTGALEVVALLDLLARLVEGVLRLLVVDLADDVKTGVRSHVANLPEDVRLRRAVRGHAYGAPSARRALEALPRHHPRTPFGHSLISAAKDIAMCKRDNAYCKRLQYMRASTSTQRGNTNEGEQEEHRRLR